MVSFIIHIPLVAGPSSPTARTHQVIKNGAPSPCLDVTPQYTLATIATTRTRTPNPDSKLTQLTPGQKTLVSRIPVNPDPSIARVEGAVRKVDTVIAFKDDDNVSSRQTRVRVKRAAGDGKCKRYGDIDQGGKFKSITQGTTFFLAETRKEEGRNWIGRCGYRFVRIASSFEVSCLGCFLLAELLLPCVHVRGGFRLCLMVRRSKSRFRSLGNWNRSL